MIFIFYTSPKKMLKKMLKIDFFYNKCLLYQFAMSFKSYQFSINYNLCLKGVLGNHIPEIRKHYPKTAWFVVVDGDRLIFLCHSDFPDSSMKGWFHSSSHKGFRILKKEHRDIASLTLLKSLA